MVRGTCAQGRWSRGLFPKEIFVCLSIYPSTSIHQCLLVASVLHISKLQFGKLGKEDERLEDKLPLFPIPSRLNPAIDICTYTYIRTGISCPAH